MRSKGRSAAVATVMEWGRRHRFDIKDCYQPGDDKLIATLRAIHTAWLDEWLSSSRYIKAYNVLAEEAGLEPIPEILTPKTVLLDSLRPELLSEVVVEKITDGETQELDDDMPKIIIRRHGKTFLITCSELPRT